MRQEDPIGLLGVDQLLERQHEAVRGVVLQRRIVDDDDLRRRRPRRARRDGVHAGTEHGDLHRPARSLRGGDRLERGAIERAVAMFGDDEDHSALASSRRRLTSSFAASAGAPGSICVFLPFSGK